MNIEDLEPSVHTGAQSDVPLLVKDLLTAACCHTWPQGWSLPKEGEVQAQISYRITHMQNFEVLMT